MRSQVGQGPPLMDVGGKAQQVVMCECLQVGDLLTGFVDFLANRGGPPVYYALSLGLALAPLTAELVSFSRVLWNPAASVVFYPGSREHPAAYDILSFSRVWRPFGGGVV